MPHHTITTDVLVVGAGPAGLTVAGALARQGVDVLVVERHAGTSPFPKATGISTRTMEIFRSWGIDAEIRAGAMRVRPVMTMSRTIADGPFMTMPFGFPSDAEALAVSPATPCCCAQDHLEPVLLRHLLARGGQVRFDTELVALRRPRRDRADPRSGRRPRSTGTTPGSGRGTWSARTARAAPCARPPASRSTTSGRSASSSR